MKKKKKKKRRTNQEMMREKDERATISFLKPDEALVQYIGAT